MGKDLGIEKARGIPFIKPASRSDLLREDSPTGFKISPFAPGFPSIGKFDVRCMMLQTAYMESNFDYTLQTGDYYGRYQMHKNQLINYGYLTQEGEWTGLNGINDAAGFLSSAGLQDILMQIFLQSAYTELCRNNGIREKDKKEVAAGMILVAYSFRSSNDLYKLASQWRVTGSSFDENKNPRSFFYNAGRHALKSLASDVTS